MCNAMKANGEQCTRKGDGLCTQHQKIADKTKTKKTKTKKTKPVDKPRCEGITKDGERCTNASKEGGFCGIHKLKKTTKDKKTKDKPRCDGFTKDKERCMNAAKEGGYCGRHKPFTTVFTEDVNPFTNMTVKSGICECLKADGERCTIKVKEPNEYGAYCCKRHVKSMKKKEEKEMKRKEKEEEKKEKKEKKEKEKEEKKEKKKEKEEKTDAQNLIEWMTTQVKKDPNMNVLLLLDAAKMIMSK